MAATNTFMSFLMHSTDGTTYTKLADIISYPDLGGSPETIDVTTLSDRMMTNILGLQSADSMEFPILYEKGTFTTIKKLENKTEHYSVWLGGDDDGTTVTPTGDLGKFSFDGMLNIRVTGAGANEARKATITLAASTPITFE